MPKSCTVRGCTNNNMKNFGLIFSLFPSKDRFPDRWNRWVAVIREAAILWSEGELIDKMMDWEPKSKWVYVCGQHFTTGQSNKDSSHIDYIPSIFPQRPPAKATSKKNKSKRKQEFLQAGPEDKTVTKSKRVSLPKSAIQIMKSWLYRHVTHPFPTEAEKRQIATETNLTYTQVNNWFLNAQYRNFQSMFDVLKPGPSKTKILRRAQGFASLAGRSSNSHTNPRVPLMTLPAVPASAPAAGMHTIIQPSNFDLNSDESCVGTRKRKGSKTAFQVMQSWLKEHEEHPYPTEAEKRQLAKKTKLSVSQVRNWFTNARRKLRQDKPATDLSKAKKPKITNVPFQQSLQRTNKIKSSKLSGSKPEPRVPLISIPAERVWRPQAGIKTVISPSDFSSALSPQQPMSTDDGPMLGQMKHSSTSLPLSPKKECIDNKRSHMNIGNSEEDYTAVCDNTPMCYIDNANGQDYEPCVTDTPVYYIDSGTSQTMVAHCDNIPMYCMDGGNSQKDHGGWF